MATLSQILDNHVRPAELAEPLAGERVRCLACGHRCRIAVGRRGVCQVRFNQEGTLLAPWGYVASLHVDPIEKKPFYHVAPGSQALSFGMLGCDLHCGFCQNWITSQALRDSRAVAPPMDVSPERLVGLAVHDAAAFVVSTYNEPLISAEWAAAVFRLAKQAGLGTGFVSSGNATPEVLEYLRPQLDLFKVDLKCFSDASYRRLGGRLQPVLDSIRRIHELGYWMEVVTLVIPGFNDSTKELTALAGFLAEVSPDIPWHVTAYHRDYKWDGPPETPVHTLQNAAEIGRKMGLRYVYAGNLPGRWDEAENTRCHGCGETLVRRRGFRLLEYGISPDGTCPHCSSRIPGRWALPPANALPLGGS